jgi:spermidine/putrescine transport system permease protein
MILFSFNDPAGRTNLSWRGFSLDAWLHPLARPGLPTAVANSLIIAFVSTFVATVLGTLIGLALVRYSFRGRSATNTLIFLPMSTPEIVLGASLLTTFIASVQLPFVPEGLVYPLSIRTIIIAHIMFNISFVVVTVKARLQGFPRHLEEAAMDLGANEWTTFWKVTFPLILPGVMAAALLAFSLSIDDYVITSFTAGQTPTFPLYIYGSQLRGIPVQVNVIGTTIFVVAVGLVVVTTLWQRRVAARDYSGATA